MRVYFCTDHDSHYPVGCASVVIAVSESHARELLDKALIEDGLKPSSEDAYILVEIELDKPHAIILVNGDY